VEPIAAEAVTTLRTRRHGLLPSQLIVLSFAAAIAAGTLVLRLPIAHSPEANIGWLEALFTATSAVCVTGLIVVDTGRDFSPVGQAIIAILIQMGGLGILTVGTLLALVTGRRLGFRQRMNVQTQLSALQVGGVVRLVRGIVLVVLGVELAGAPSYSIPGWRRSTDGAWAPGKQSFTRSARSTMPASRSTRTA
jgi:trk system potassium uptake protein TrkH